MEQFTAVILAAGLGKRMKSSTPKVLHTVCGKAMVEHVVDAAVQAGIERIVVVVGHGADRVKDVLGDRVLYALQQEQLGTGHALLMAKEQSITAHVIVLSGDAPLLRPETIKELMDEHLRTGSGATVLSAVVADPTRYGRIIRAEDNSLNCIVEEGDATPEQRRVCEINTGTYCFDRDVFDYLATLGRSNAQGEYYLTDAVIAFRKAGRKVSVVKLQDAREGEAPNDRVQLAATVRLMQQRILEDLMLSGVTVIDPSNTYVDAGVEVGRDTVLWPGTVLQGRTKIGSNCVIGPFTHLRDTVAGNQVAIQHSVVSQSRIDDRVTIGPYAHIRPETVLERSVKVGNFVEIKKSNIGEGSKVPHLSYVGDTTMGSGVNFGAGAITCNYDGAHKHPTLIEDNAFIGSNANLVAPVTVGKEGFVAAGSTITKPVPPGSLAIGRARQVIKEDYRRRRD